ncbi:unnamed protein product [Adineta steineri]|uniref:Uncharacterized protein n=1 Tax=Adineta steineri TaxID=433720 RepID=A0A814QWR4_9BILA|nr:unnamed protein product [Adineta steineri]CAF1528360.1 unnamed protein product [Adineta steineri]
MLAPQDQASTAEARTLVRPIHVWLDQNVNTDESNRIMKEKFKGSVHRFEAFDSIDQCERFIERWSSRNIVFIVSGSLGREILPRIHSLPQLLKCYVYCGNKQANEQWAQQYFKIKGVFDSSADLIKVIAPYHC